ncbi:MAG: hypothetical protein LBK61_11570 [Spirochaetaceae bacterium]|nr:hypothetical protein [Spirochaetaceae bacterium]
MRNNNMTRTVACFKRLAAFVPVFALIVMFSGCTPEFDDRQSDNYANTETPGVPRNVKAKALSSGSIKISWDPVQGCTNYKIYYLEDGVWWTMVGNEETPLYDTVYLDEYVDPGTSYTYRVSAYRKTTFYKESPKSSPVTATTLEEGADPIEEVLLDPPETIYVNASSPTSIGLTWTSVADATGYNIYSSNAEDGYYTFRFYHAQYSSPSWNDNDCQPGETRYYRIATVSADGEGAKSGPYFATTQSVSSAPGTPTDVSATADGTTITVTWTMVSGATLYEVYRSSSESGYYAYQGYTSSTSYTDMDLTTNATYYYKVTALNSLGPSGQSSSVSATTTTSGGSGAAGSSAATAITLSSSYSTSAIITTDNPEMWFRAYIADSNTHCLLGWDRYGPDNHTGDVAFEIYDSGVNKITTIDAGNGGSFDNPGGFSGSNYLKSSWSSGWLYIKAVPYNGNPSNCGTFAIRFF